MLGCEIRRIEVCASTNDEAASWARDRSSPAVHGSVVVAREQTAGRGRQGRHWHSPPGENLYFSCVLRPPLKPHKVPPLTICAGLAVCEVVNSLGVSASIKWPNDVMIGEHKLAGVLTEMSTQDHELNAVIIGIGLNVNTREFPSDLCATSLWRETRSQHTLPSILGSLLFSLDQWYEKYLDTGVCALQPDFSKYCMLSGRPIRARVGGRLVSGSAIALGVDGSLVLEDASGSRHHVIAGEVEILSK